MTLGVSPVPTSNASTNYPLGWACRQFVHSFIQQIFVESLLCTEANSFHLPQDTFNRASPKPPSIDSITLASFCFILEGWKDNSGLGQSRTRCLGKKPPGIRQESHMVDFHTSFKGLWLHLWPWNPQLFPQRTLGS